MRVSRESSFIKTDKAIVSGGGICEKREREDEIIWNNDTMTFDDLAKFGNQFSFPNDCARSDTEMIMVRMPHAHIRKQKFK